MKNIKNKAFTLVELLVVITILAIISVVAYQNFGGAVDKAISGRKISDVSTIETSLKQYKIDNNYYPSVFEVSSTNVWGYDSSVVAQQSNTISVDYIGDEIGAVGSGSMVGGGRVMDGATQIGAKGTISREKIGKKYLSKDLYDPELGDLTAGSSKMFDYGVGRYIYAVYKKSTGANWTFNKKGTSYNLAFTIKDSTGEEDVYKTKIVGDFDEETCTNCPTSLIGEGSTNVLVDGQELSSDDTTSDTQGIPYPVTDFAQF